VDAGLTGKKGLSSLSKIDPYQMAWEWLGSINGGSVA